MNQLTTFKKVYLFLIGCLLCFSANSSAFGQITITNNDMPSAGDTIRKSTNFTTNGVDYTLTGENYNWDFSGLTSLIQTVDTFASVGSVPFFYQLVFIPNLVANLAQKYSDIDTIPDIEIVDPYRFFKNSSSSFNDVGIAVTINSLPIPLKYDSPDIVYVFPVGYGNSDSCNSSLDLSLAGIGYIGIDRKRVNHVDGWGTLETPNGTFDVIRQKSEVFEEDTIYIDSIGFGFAINREYTEYKWIGNNHGIPLLQVTEEGLVVTVQYIDSIRNPVTAVPETLATGTRMQVVPNPVSHNTRLKLDLQNSSRVELDIFNLSGVKVADVFSGIMSAGYHEIPVDNFTRHLPKGIYIVQFKTEKHLINQKLIIP